MKQEGIPFHIFHIDDHIVERNKRYHTGYEEWYEYYYLQWDIEWLRQKFFQKLQHETKLKLPFFMKKQIYVKWKSTDSYCRRNCY